MKHYELYKDEELVNMYRDGDARAVDEIMERYKNLVRKKANAMYIVCLLYTSPSPRDRG